MAGESAVGGAGSVAERTLSSPGYFPPDSVVLGFLRTRVDAGRAAGLVVGLLEVDGTRRIVACGRSDGPGNRPLDGATLFEIGSVTKVFTCSLLSQMVARGEVRLEEPVAELLPGKVKVPARGDTVITLLDLATQTSGLPRLPGNLKPRTMA